MKPYENMIERKYKKKKKRLKNEAMLYEMTAKFQLGLLPNRVSPRSRTQSNHDWRRMDNQL